ncbi:2-oxoglutarate dehydrogenase complex dihydrolipoyllysine-residue succinyltransferase [Pararhizobium sp. IMCC21322]|uniref:2-oxoglutarate dehydrogenase complex dihydrolipoyllysine-residue succinyltransferase n=1 Tax=Pararhizobium sp. IMCC21322 TaxID=3067903 RepID=UPI0027421DE9|nr:2-oxoglutarate dehydrogenase complex dihydrolipoyllysine-residue succinyltransferase [Pararhizobium sp. IMCC21322]
MATEIRVPTLGESVTEATIGQWYKKVGDAVNADEPLVELETDKVTVEVPAPSSGVLSEIIAQEGETVEVGALLAALDAGASAGASSGASGNGAAEAEAAAEPAPAQEAAPAAEASASAMPASPAAAKKMAEHDLTEDDVEGTGKRGQILKEDVMASLDQGIADAMAAPAAKAEPAAPEPAAAPSPEPAAAAPAPATPAAARSGDDGSREERVRMTKLRQTIARRLKDAQNSAAMLTTFNEVDMTNVMALRKDYKELFEKKHGVKLGFMGFFAKAVIQALKDVPSVNAEVDGTDIVYKNFYHIGVAVGTEKGLVVPVVKEADTLSIAEVEKTIGAYGKKARDGKLSIADMQGGTFTISNGGVYGSLMSTPILNAPQSGILGMHKIQERPMVVGGEIKIRPMMYLALSYDHRIVDGKEAVTFLVRVKEAIEDPQRLVLDL